MSLEKEMETCQRELPSLLSHEGKFVLIQDDSVIEVFGTYEDALREGYQKFGLDTPFLVKQIHAVEELQFIRRDVIFPCRT